MARASRLVLVPLLCVLVLASGGVLVTAPARAGTASVTSASAKRTPAPGPTSGGASRRSPAGTDSTTDWGMQFPVDPGFSSCPSFSFCVWRDYDAQGWGWTGNLVCGSNLVDFRNSGLQDNVSAVKNNTTVVISLLDTDLNGKWYVLAAAGQGWGGNLYYTINDKADGFQWRC